MLDNVRNRPGYTSWIRVRHLLSKQTDGGAGPLRGPTRPAPSKRWRFDRDELETLITDLGLTPTEAAFELGISLSLLLQNLHRHHLPVRPGQQRFAEARIRYNDLLATPGVAEALARHGVTPAGPDPEPAPALPPGLLADLVGQLGLTTFDVELLTGRRRTAVLRDLKAPR